ncbi:MAG: hypothetical protein MUF23_07360 [Pirellula sp.]|jgi:hypothetical protein|nr:hypothetical protein [Pirellula sp.]
MTDCNPYETPSLTYEVRPDANLQDVVRRIVWSAGCFAIGAGLSWGLPILLIYLGLWNGGSGQGALAGLFVLYMSGFASILSGFVGFVSGAFRPGRYAILATLVCLVLTDFIALVYVYTGNDDFVLLYLVSAIAKVTGMFVFVPKNAMWLNCLVITTGITLFLCIAVWLAR